MSYFAKSYPKIVPALVCMLCVTPANAQIQVLPDSSAVWNYREYDVFNTFDYRQTFLLPAIGVDTLINGISYRPLNWYWDSEPWPGTFGGGLREDGMGKVYYYSPHHDTEYLLYDLDVQAGDSVGNVWVGYPHTSTPYLYTTHVVSRGTLNINGVARRSIGIRLSSDPGPAIHYWVEGIGGSAGLMSTIGANALDVAFGLECMSSNDTVWWAWGPVGAPGHCSPMGTTEWTQERISISPNPSSGRFTVVLNPRMAESWYSVYDALGKLLYQRPWPSGKQSEELDLSRFGTGTYVVRFTDRDGSCYERVVVE